jgi:ATP-dependent Lon protease
MRRVDEKFTLLPKHQQREIESRLTKFAEKNLFASPPTPLEAEDEEEVPKHRVFDPNALSALAKYAVTNENLKPRASALRSLRPDVKLAVLQEHWPAKLEQLKTDWPNFHEVIEQVECDLTLSCAISKPDQPCPITLTPMLMVGPPGCGKSSFMSALSEALNLAMHRKSLETMMTASELLGSSRTYSNSEPGIFFNLLTATGGVPQQLPANFLLALDELDKIAGDKRFPPVNMLLSLLEPSTNSKIADASAQIEMDLSRVNFLFTANDLNTGAISEPLLSRLTVRQIEPLSFDQMCTTTQRLYQELIADFTLPTELIPTLNDDAIASLAASTSVREQKLRLRAAMGHALKHRLPILHVAAGKKIAGRRIGFY